MAARRKYLVAVIVVSLWWILMLNVLIGIPFKYKFHPGEKEFSLKQWLNHAKVEKNSNGSCEVVHVVVVCYSASAARELVVTLKSILLHRRRPIHLHIITDTFRRQKVLSHLLTTWNVTSLDFSTYLSTNGALEVAWIKSSHTSGFGFLKLAVPSILPKNFKKVILLDRKIIFLSDIGTLWDMFDGFSSEQCLGMVAKSSSKVTEYNSDVVLMDLEKLRLLPWTSVYTRIAEEQLKIFDSAKLARQDIYNAVISQFPGMVRQLPCVYNFQDFHIFEKNLCPSLVSEIKVMSFNIRKKYHVLRNFVHPLFIWYQFFAELSGSFVRQNFMGCSNLSVSAYAAKRDPISSPVLDFKTRQAMCDELPTAYSLRYRTHLFYTEFDYQSQTVDVSLVTHLTTERLASLDEVLSRWRGPASVALYVTDSEVYRFKQYLKHCPSVNRKNVAFHIVYQEGAIYPINQLKNVALTNVVTPFVLLVDADFIPADDLYADLIIAIKNQGDLRKKALIVPAFETFSYQLDFPNTKSELLQMLEDDQIFSFKQEKSPAGDDATLLHRWKTASLPYKVSWSINFEPFVVVRSDVVRYDERFIRYEWSTASYIMELSFSGYEFIILPDVFTIHFPHASSFEDYVFRDGHFYDNCVNLLKQNFIINLTKKYGRN